MSLRLVLGPTASGKTARAIESFLKAVHEGKNPAFIAPSMPDARHFQRHILAQSGLALAGGEVTTFDSMIGGLCLPAFHQLRVISPLERSQIIREVIRRQPHDTLSPSWIFDGFAADLTSLISELHSQGIDGGQVEKGVRALSGSVLWKNGFNRGLSRIYLGYRQLLAELNLLDPEDAKRRAACALAEDPLLLERRLLVFDGFWNFTPVQRAFIEALKTSEVDLVVTLPYQEGHPAFSSTAAVLADLQGAEVEFLKAPADDDRHPALRHISLYLFQPEAPKISGEGAVTILKAAGPRGQAELVAAEVLRLERSGVALDDIAIVTRGQGPDSTAIASALGAFGVPFEMAAPAPLSATGIGQTALAALALVAPPGHAENNLLAYLRSPLSVADAAQVDDFDRHIRKLAISDAEKQLRLWQEVTGRQLDGIARLSQAAIEGVPELAAALMALMRDLFAKAAAAQLDAQEIEMNALALRDLGAACAAAARLAQSFSTVETEAAGGGRPQSPEEISCGTLREAIKLAVVRPASGRKRDCVRLLDPHRALNQNFEVVFICGLLEGQFPSLGGENAFLSDSERRWLHDHGLFELDTHERRLDDERFLFYRTLTRARSKIYLCYPYCDHEGRPNINSLLVDDVQDLLNDRSWDRVEKKIDEVVFASNRAPTADQALLSLCLAAPPEASPARPSSEGLLAAAAPAGLGERLKHCLAAARVEPASLSEEARGRLKKMEHFRVTELEEYLCCPRRYFLSRVIQSAPLAPDTFFLERGLAVHEILAEFFAALDCEQVFLPRATAKQIEEAKQIMSDIVCEKLAGAGADLQTLIMKTHLLGHLDRFVERERSCRPQFRPHKFELSFGICDGPSRGLPDETTALRLGDVIVCGRIDRIDLREGKKQAIIIDYKTSADSNLPSRQSFEARGVLQAPLYMLAVRDILNLEPVGAEYYGILGEKRRGIYLSEHAPALGYEEGELVRTDFVDVHDFEECIQSARSRAVQAAEGIRAGSFECRPAEGVDCERSCGLKDLCRIDEQAVLTGARS